MQHLIGGEFCVDFGEDIIAVDDDDRLGVALEIEFYISAARSVIGYQDCLIAFVGVGCGADKQAMFLQVGGLDAIAELVEVVECLEGEECSCVGQCGELEQAAIGACGGGVVIHRLVDSAALHYAEGGGAHRRSDVVAELGLAGVERIIPLVEDAFGFGESGGVEFIADVFGMDSDFKGLVGIQVPREEVERGGVVFVGGDFYQVVEPFEHTEPARRVVLRFAR